MPESPDQNGQAGAEIEITPEMIEAGVSVLCEFNTFEASEEYWARRVFAAMVSVAPESHHRLKGIFECVGWLSRSAISKINPSFRLIKNRS